VKGGNVAAAAELDCVFANCDIVTAGTLPGCTKPGIDHIALSGHLQASKAEGWPHDVTGNRLSDHDGSVVHVLLGRSNWVAKNESN